MEEITSIYDVLHEDKVKFYKLQQGDDETLADYMRHFKDLCNSIEYHGVGVFNDKKMAKKEMRTDIEINKISHKGNKYRI